METQFLSKYLHERICASKDLILLKLAKKAHYSFEESVVYSTALYVERTKKGLSLNNNAFLKHYLLYGRHELNLFFIYSIQFL